MRQSWCDLLFAHWPVPESDLRAHIPDELEIDTYDGTAWLGVVPFRMADVAPRGIPAVPGISAFPEINVRTYVKRDGIAGVWFQSLDVTKRLAVWIARKLFHLPYFHAQMKAQNIGDAIQYESSRTGSSVPTDFQATYGPTSEPYLSSPGSLEHWLTERYCLYAQSERGVLYRADVHHVPWPLQKASASFQTNTMGKQMDIALDNKPAELHFARQVDVVVWSPQRVN